MSISTLILGESGTGKTASLRNLNPKTTLLIQPVRKPLPFRSPDWHECRAKGDGGNIFVSDNPETIIKAMHKTTAEVIVLDDWQYILTNMFMNKRALKGFDKFTEIAGAGYDLCMAANQLDFNKRVYVMAHTQTDDLGVTRIKTLGKLLDDKIVPEGLFTTVLRTHVESGRYQFSTHNSGSDTVKSPMGLFEDDFIENDLDAVDSLICEYYRISRASEETAPETATE